MIRSICLPILSARAALAVALSVTLVAACAKPAPPTDGSPSADKSRLQTPVGSAASVAATASSPPAATAAAAATPAALDGGGAPSDAGATAQPAPAPEPTPAPIVADNQVKPEDGTPEELAARAKDLFEAIVSDEPAKGDPFWFPKEPFIPLKDVKGPDKYWDNLHKAYAADIHKAHKKHKSWDGAVFEGFDVGSKPKWVKPGDEANKIGYYRSFHGKIRFEQGGQKHTIDVHTIITWQGRWYVTHLGKFKK